MSADLTLICADVREALRGLPPASVQTCVTSPPYYGLRSYGIPPSRWADGWEGCLGDEPVLEQYLQHLVEIFREVRRVLHPSGTLWLNLGDCYAGGGKHQERPEIYGIPEAGKPTRPRQRSFSGKDLLMIPARAALALQADGWILRSDIIWAKAVSFLPAWSGSVMPESTQDRPVWSHEHLFLLTREERYFYDIDGCREPYADSSVRDARVGYRGRGRKAYGDAGVQNPSDVKRRVQRAIQDGAGRNLRNVWIVPKQNFPGAHFATFPEKLVEPCVRLGTSERGECPVCAAPLRRRTIREPIPATVQAKFEASREASRADTGRADGHTLRRPNFRRRVLRTEWEPSCDCAWGTEDADALISAARPQTVLDIFNGSGRTGMVARRLGRSYIGIDINPEYVEMTRRAILGVEVSDGVSSVSDLGAPAAPDDGGAGVAVADPARGGPAPDPAE